VININGAKFEVSNFDRSLDMACHTVTVQRGHLYACPRI